MNTLSNIIEIIKMNDTPFLTLHVKEMHKSSFAGKFNCETCDSSDDKVEKAIEWLTSYINLFPENTLFIVTARNSMNSNGSGIIGPLSFISGNTQNSLSGINQNNINYSELGYIHKSELDAALARKELAYKEQRMQDQFDLLKQRYEDTIENIQSIAGRWSPEAVTSLVGQLTTAYSALSGKVLPGNLSGINYKNIQKTLDQNPYIKKINTELENLPSDKQAIALNLLLKYKDKLTDKSIQQSKTKTENEQRTNNQLPQKPTDENSK